MQDDISRIAQQLTRKIEKTREKPYNKDEHRDLTRSALARWFVKGYFIIIVSLIILIPAYNAFVYKYVSETLVLRFEETFTAVSSSVVGLLGFVLGFYFKEGDK